ncbi:MAG: hypothetical protein L0H29_01335, partial [Sinobacteraceae bacterium]|nr:hypothetical protein [Nevskiaceae bacterium]
GFSRMLYDTGGRRRQWGLKARCFGRCRTTSGHPVNAELELGVPRIRDCFAVLAMARTVGNNKAAEPLSLSFAP